MNHNTDKILVLGLWAKVLLANQIADFFPSRFYLKKYMRDQGKQKPKFPTS